MQPSHILIQGITSTGRKFRPSDWAERLSGLLASIGADRKPSYHPALHPLVRGNVHCVAVDRSLETAAPAVFQFLLDFARDNDLQVSEI